MMTAKKKYRRGILLGMMLLSLLVLVGCSSGPDPSLRFQLLESADSLPDAEILRILIAEQTRFEECSAAIHAVYQNQGKELNRKLCGGVIRKEIVEEDKDKYLVEFHVDYPSCNEHTLPMVSLIDLHTREVQVIWAAGQRPDPDYVQKVQELLQIEDCEEFAEQLI